MIAVIPAVIQPALLPISRTDASSPLFQRVRQTAQSAFNSFERFWNYAGKSMLLTRHLLNTTIKSCVRLLNRCSCEDTRLFDTVRRLKLFTIFSIPLNVLQFPGAFRNFGQNIVWRDGKETLLSSLSVAILAADTLDTLATFTSAALATLSKTVPAAVSAVGMPLGYGMSGIGAFNRSVRIADMTRFIMQVELDALKKISDPAVSENEVKAILKGFIDVQLKNQVGNERKHLEALVARKSNGTALSLLKKLEALTAKEGDLTQEEIATAKALLVGISKNIKRERTIHSIYMSANLATLAALSFFTLSIGTFSPYLLLASSAALRISAQVYQDRNR